MTISGTSGKMLNKKYGALAVIGVVGVALVLIGGESKAHAKPRPLPLPPPPVPMPPPVSPSQPDAVVIDRPGEPSEEVPVGDVLMDEISYEEPGKAPLIQQVPQLPEDDQDDQDDDLDVLPAEEQEPEDEEATSQEQNVDDDDDDTEDHEDVLVPVEDVQQAPPIVEQAPPLDIEQAPPVVPQAPPEQVRDPEQPTVIAQDTLDLLRIMLRDETGANWKRKVPELVPWQASRGLVADGEFGPKSGLKMAEETGLLPVVRFWPRGSFPEGAWLPDYQRAIRSLSMRLPDPHAAQLVAAANREQGQGFGRGQAPINPTIVI